jgi:glucokinase
MRYKNSACTNFEAVLDRSLADINADRPDSICLAVAGPVENGTATLTNLDWTLSETALSLLTSSGKSHIINDLQAQGHALASLKPDSIRTVLTGNANNGSGTKLMVGVGTGFNSAPVFDFKGTLMVPPSETGHAILPTRTEQDFSLSQSLTDSHGFPATEEILSGRGLEKLYAFLADEKSMREKLTAHEIMRAYAEQDETANDAVRYFSHFLGTICGDLALIQLPVGGIFLVGGMSRAFAPYLKACGFAESFRDKGRFSSFMNQFAVHVVEDDDAALIGCIVYSAAK